MNTSLKYFLEEDITKQCLVQTGTGKVDPARKFKCTTATRAGKN